MACDDFLSFVKSDHPCIYNDSVDCEDDTIDWFLRKYEEYSTIQPFDYMQFSNSKGQSYTERDRLFKIIRMREGKDRNS